MQTVRAHRHGKSKVAIQLIVSALIAVLRIPPMQAAGEKLPSSMNKTLVDYKFTQLHYGVTEVDNSMQAPALSNFDERTQEFAVKKGLSADQDSGR